ncbi:hypothetical protein LWC33_34310 [Pseudonocardia sp. RS11V-5]|uniref:hypothetical protein n=1 Tax=Pseudonocardia terrae TaxID=2905831 RepID=UPI001E3CB292|nr:hypothetical protein [Pseudonocardia terrae]MCE3556501.1 hypothetical protein [Pseudonocardia terrae]
MTERTGDAPGDEGADHALTGDGSGTARGDYDHEGNPRTPSDRHDAGATDDAAHELDRENESEPTRSE